MRRSAFSVSIYAIFYQNQISSFMKQTYVFEYERRIHINLLVIISRNLYSHIKAKWRTALISPEEYKVGSLFILCVV
jgi:hypothetical protein